MRRIRSQIFSTYVPSVFNFYRIYGVYALKAGCNNSPGTFNVHAWLFVSKKTRVRVCFDSFFRCVLVKDTYYHKWYTDRRTDGQTDGRHDDANSRSYYVSVRSAKSNANRLIRLGRDIAGRKLPRFYRAPCIAATSVKGLINRVLINHTSRPKWRNVIHSGRRAGGHSRDFRHG